MVHLHVPGRNAALSLPATSEVLVGRSDAVSGVYPDIDLTPYEGIEKGVGRRHLLMSINDQGQVVIEDLNSTNGTYLNNQRLSPQQPQPIADGDEIRLGKLVLRVQL
jgi:pSer/pThr/pTyr-binding forkhead associated (FHA) protein